MNPFERLAVLETLGGAPARFVEPRAQLGVLALLGGRAWHALPLGARFLELVGRVVAAQRVDTLAERHKCRAAGGGALGLGQPLGFFPASRLDCRARLGQLSSELRVAIRIRVLGELLPLAGGVVELVIRVGRAWRGRNRVDSRDDKRHALLPLLEGSLPGKLGVVHFLDERFGALGDRFVFRARGDAVEQLAALGVRGD